jgi:methyltransferase (TIGR00027 family)
MARAAAKTGTGPTAMVALEQGFPKENRILTDDVAYSVLPLGKRVFLCLLRPRWARNWLVRRSEKASPGSYGAILCRKRYIDEKLLEYLDRIDALVNLGAGFDTRMYRLRALALKPVWEADLPENIQSKRLGLRRVFGAVPAHVTLVAIDFEHEDLGAALASHGFSAAVRTLYIWEAVTQYLTEPTVRATFDFLAKAAKGSRLVFSYIRKDFLDGRVLYGQEYLYKRYVVKAGVWHFGMDPEAVTSLLSSYGWHAVENLQYAELAERYVKPIGRKLLSTPIERIVYAEKL